MRALGGNTAVFEDDDLVGVEDGVDALGDDEGRAVLHQAVQGLLNLGFRLHVHGAGAVVEDQDPGFDQHSAGDGDALFLAAGEVGAAFGDGAVVPSGHGLDELMRLRGFGGGNDFV